MLEEELNIYSPDLGAKQRLVVGTKMDLADSADRLAALQAALDDQTCLGISAVSGYGISDLRARLEKMLAGAEQMS